MKKNLLFVIAIFIATGMSAQMYVGAKLGYGMTSQKTAIGFEYSSTGLPQANIYGGLGGGMTFGAKAGYMFTENLGVELGVNYFLGATQTFTDNQTLNNTKLHESFSNQVRLLPALVYKADNGVYGRFGIVVPVTGKTLRSETTVVTAGNGTVTTTESEMEIKGKMTMGFTAAMGYQYTLTDNLNLFCEIEYIGLTIYSNTAEVTTYTVNGADQLPAMPTWQKEIEFVDELEASSNNPDPRLGNANFDPNKPVEALRLSSNYSAVRVNVGVTMAF